MWGSLVLRVLVVARLGQLMLIYIVLLVATELSPATVALLYLWVVIAFTNLYMCQYQGTSNFGSRNYVCLVVQCVCVVPR